VSLLRWLEGGASGITGAFHRGEIARREMRPPRKTQRLALESAQPARVSMRPPKRCSVPLDRGGDRSWARRAGEERSGRGRQEMSSAASSASSPSSTM